MPKALDIRTATTDVQDAIVRALELAYLRRYPESADLTALALVDSEKLPDRALVYVQSEGVVYRLSKASTLSVALPDIVPAAGNGRWLRQTSTMTMGPNYFAPIYRVRYGVVNAVEAFQGDMSEFLDRLMGQRPAFGVEVIEDDLQLRAQRQGSIYDAKWKVIIHATTFNYRHGSDALYGSDVADDSGIASERGIYRLMGDARYLLAGTDLGLGLCIKFASIDGNGRLVEKQLGQRYFRGEIDLTVHGTVQILDEDLFPAWSANIERFDTGTPDGRTFDRANFVAQGMRITPQPGLMGVPAAGVVYLDSQLISVSPGLHTFTANRDTYRDLLPSGRLVYTDTEVGAQPPTQPAGSLRIGVTRTDASNIIGDTLLCSYRLTSAPVTGDPFTVEGGT